MTSIKSKFYSNIRSLRKALGLGMLLAVASSASAQVSLETEVKIADNGLHFNGDKITHGTIDSADPSVSTYDYFFGRNISAHGDAVKTYGNYVFMTWYRGGKDDRHVMLSRYNKDTGTVATIEFPHRHTGFRGNPEIGESHNTIGLAVSPLNGTIHMVYDMHAYDNNNHGGVFEDDFFRYSYSVTGAADVPDDEFTLDKFVKDTSEISQGQDDYKHLTMTGDLADSGNFARLTYPKFFTTDDGVLLLYMRLGGNNNGAYIYNRYDNENEKWTRFTKFNENNQKSKGNDYNWGLYGEMKYLNGQFRIGFQQRSNDNNDRYIYQNGVYYAYLDDPDGDGVGEWKNHSGEVITSPLIDSDEIKVFEPGDYLDVQEPNSVYIVGFFDFTVTAAGDIHTISKVRTNESDRNARTEVYLHAYKPAGATEFIITEDFAGASQIYTSGDNIYIIGLNNGRPYVERARGGTNDFERVYEATDGKVFDHGTIEIADGKVYYYLMERPADGISTAMPLYLQIIDLDVEGDSNKPEVAFPNQALTVQQGYEQLTFTINTSSPVEGRTISSVALYINDELVRTDDRAPFNFGHRRQPHETGAMGWISCDQDPVPEVCHEPNPNPLPAGIHNFKVVATDSEGETNFATMRLTVLGNAPIVSFPNPALTLDVGYERLNFTVSATSPVEGREISSVALYINDEFIRTDNAAPFVFGHNNKPLETGGIGDDPNNPNPNPLGVGEHIFKAVATDDVGEQTEAIMVLTVEGLPEPPTVAFPNEVVRVPLGYDKLGITLSAEAASGRSVAAVTLYNQDGDLIRRDPSVPYNFGHRFKPYEFGAMGWISCDQDPVPSPCHQPNPNALGVGTHTFTAIAEDNTGELSEPAILTLIVEAPPGPTVNFVGSELELDEGYEALSVSIDVETANEQTTVTSAALYLDDGFVRELLEAPFTWGNGIYSDELLGMTEGTHNLKAVVTDSNGQITEATLLVMVNSAALLGDWDLDGDVDSDDIRIFMSVLRTQQNIDMDYDLNGDGVVNTRDARTMRSLCTRSRCARQ